MSRRRKIILLVTGLVAVATGLWVGVPYYRAKRALLVYKERLSAAGEYLSIEKVVPRPAPPEQNSARIFSQATALLSAGSFFESNLPPVMHMTTPGRAMIGWQQPDIRGYEATNTWEEADAVIARDHESLELLHEIINRPVLDFTLDYRGGPTLLLPHLGTLKHVVQRLAAATVCDLHRNDVASAATHTRAILALVKGSRDERLLISQLVRMGMAQIALAAQWELLQSRELTDDQLAVLQDDWTQLEFVEAGENALRMERASVEAAIENARNSSAGYHQLVTGWGVGGAAASGSGNWTDRAEEFLKRGWDDTRLRTKEAMWRVSWSYPDELRSLKGYQVLIDTARSVRTNRVFQPALHEQSNRLAALGITAAVGESDWMAGLDGLNMRSLFSQNVESVSRVFNRVTATEALRQMAITAIALRRYEQRHGSVPPGLAELVPEFLPAVPCDPVDGQPLRYRQDGRQSYALYSIGEDGRDDGGDPKPIEGSPSRAWIPGRDWVWPQPATADEVKAEYERMAKTGPAGDASEGHSIKGTTPQTTNGPQASPTNFIPVTLPPAIVMTNRTQ